MILNKTLWFWLIHRFDHYKDILGFFIVTGFLHIEASSFLHAFFYESPEDKREWVVKQCQKLWSKVKESLVKLVNVLLKSIYIYVLYITSHLVILSHRQSYLVFKLVSIIDLSLSDAAFSVWFYNSAYIDNIFPFWI